MKKLFLTESELKNLIRKIKLEIIKENKKSLLNESFSRLIMTMKNKSFCVATAFRKSNSDELNRKLNRDLLQTLNSMNMGPLRLIGHWRETKKGETRPWYEVPESELIDTVEDSYLFSKPARMSLQAFKDFCQEITLKYEQDCVMFGVANADVEEQQKRQQDFPSRKAFLLSGGVYYLSGNGVLSPAGEYATLNKKNQGYSQYSKRLDTPFVIEDV